MNCSEWLDNSSVESNGIIFIGDRKFDYSDGDRAERYVSTVIRSAHDLSSDSLELEKAIRDWPSKYHLSRDRSNCYRSMHFPKNASVLEIGSGCGAITRYLAENVATVVALEGSARRAQITRSRTRDLENVIVVCGSFEAVQFKSKFDYVVCNGVLEYTPLFFSCEDPVQKFLELLATLVNPSGSAIIAIENKTGLRYFSSGKEEHTGTMFDGLEGYARLPRGPRTYGKSELQSLLSGYFSSIDVLLPLPDYKLPSAIVRETLTAMVDCSELFAASDRYDFGSAISPMLHERLTWRALNKTKLLPQLSNSLFVVAGQDKTSLFDANWLGDLYSNGRRLEYTTRTQIIRAPEGHITTIKKRVFASNTIANSFVSHREVNGAWIEGPSVHTLLAGAFVRKEQNLSLDDRIRIPISAWWKSLQKHVASDGKLAGQSIDCIWQNSIYKNGLVQSYDEEWELAHSIDPLTLIYRSVISFTGKEIIFLHRWAPTARNCTQFALIRSVARIVGMRFSFSGLARAVKLDLEFAAVSRGHKHAFVKHFARLFVPLNILRLKAECVGWLRLWGARVTNRLARFVS